MGQIVPDAPRAAEALGLVEQYSYLRGASGARYLFTAIPQAGARDYPGSVIVVTAGSAHTRRIVWIGEVDEAGRCHGTATGRRGRRTTTFVHLLARSAEKRRQVVRDLRQEADAAMLPQVPREAAE